MGMKILIRQSSFIAEFNGRSRGRKREKGKKKRREKCLMGSGQI